MEIINLKNLEFNFREELKPLFDAMLAGEKIKSVTCMKGIANKSDSSKDFVIENFIPTTYEVALGWSSEGGYDDYVRASATTERDFYMSWVRSFELY